MAGVWEEKQRGTWARWSSRSKGVERGREMLDLLCTEMFPKVPCLPRAA